MLYGSFVDLSQWLWFGFWSAVIFGSLVWYGTLVFYVGWHGAKEIVQLARRMKDEPQSLKEQAS
ncbi:MAG: hypothetical protein NZ899_02735 [Thermoguttaceae bacterium]|nr:hypothetical protein [Thermoguttaceae bacterium]MDW8079757.1 hypothetical protein [Thermoguttaceae bacterium]